MPPSADPPSAPDAPPNPIAREAMLVDFLAEHDVPCPLCGYNLRDLRSSRCPECGRELKLTVEPAESYLFPYLLLLWATCVPAGLGLVLWVILLGGLFGNGASDLPEVPLLALLGMAYFLGMVPVSFLVIANRRRLLRLKTTTQERLAGIAVVLCILAFLSSLFIVAL